MATLVPGQGADFFAAFGVTAPNNKYWENTYV